MQPPKELVNSDADKAIWRAAADQAKRLGKGQDRKYVTKLFKEIKRQKNEHSQADKTQPESKKNDSQQPSKKDKTEDKKDEKDKKDKTSSLSSEALADVLDKTANFIESVDSQYRELKKKKQQKKEAKLENKKERIRETIRAKSGKEPRDEAVEKLAAMDDSVLEDTLFQLSTNPSRGSDMAEPAKRQGKEARKQDAIAQDCRTEGEERFVRWCTSD